MQQTDLGNDAKTLSTLREKCLSTRMNLVSKTNFLELITSLEMLLTFETKQMSHSLVFESIFEEEMEFPDDDRQNNKTDFCYSRQLLKAGYVPYTGKKENWATIFEQRHGLIQRLKPLVFCLMVLINPGVLTIKQIVMHNGAQKRNVFFDLRKRQVILVNACGEEVIVQWPVENVMRLLFVFFVDLGILLEKLNTAWQTSILSFTSYEVKNLTARLPQFFGMPFSDQELKMVLDRYMTEERTPRLTSSCPDNFAQALELPDGYQQAVFQNICHRRLDYNFIAIGMMELRRESDKYTARTQLTQQKDTVDCHAATVQVGSEISPIEISDEETVFDSPGSNLGGELYTPETSPLRPRNTVSSSRGTKREVLSINDSPTRPFKRSCM